MQKRNATDGGSTTMHSKAICRQKGGLGFKIFLFFWFSRIKRYWVFKVLCFQKFLENSREISLLDLDLEAFSIHFSFSISRHFNFILEKSEPYFHFTSHFSKRVNHIFISLFTSRKKWKGFVFFHFSLLELSISTLAGHCRGKTWWYCINLG